MENYIDISCRKWTKDCKLFESIINQGIDARLTAFTKSHFSYDGSRLNMDFHKDEMEILMRRLWDRSDYDDNADQWENDLLDIIYGIEVI